MSCIKNSVCKQCRRENAKLFLKGDRCVSDKCAFDRRPYPPGQHGQSRMKFSEFALQLREKQKAKRYYGLSEKQFVRYLEAAVRGKEMTGTALLQNLESRLDNVLYCLGYAQSRREARIMVRHNHVLINGRRANIPSINVQKGDKIEIVESSRGMTRVLAAVQSSARRVVPSWLEVDHASFSGIVKDKPAREDVGVQVEENMIVEYYSR